MKVIVVGAGKVGFYLAQTLLEHGHDPIIIEIDKTKCKSIANQLDIPVVCGDGTTIETLDNAGIEDCDALISVTGKDENNLIACQLAKKRFNIAKTVARVNNPKNAEVMKRLGVDIPISSTDSIARLLEREVDTSSIRQLLSLNRGKASISEMQIPSHFEKSGINLSDFTMPKKSIVATIYRNGEVIVPDGNTQLFAGDRLVIISENDVIHELSKLFQLKK